MKKYISLVFLLSIVFLPSCLDKGSTGSSVSDGSRVLIEINGNAALTEKQLEDFIAQTVEANPQAKMMYSMMPEMIKEQAFEAKKHCIVMSEWAKKNGIRDSKEYKDKINQIMENIYCSLDQEEFVKRHKDEVTDADVEKFYNEHKHEAHFTKAQGGIKTVGVEFAKKEDADKFAAEVAGKAHSLEKIAKDKKLHFKDFGSVSADSFAPKYVKSAVESVAKFPAIKVVKGDNGKFWVVAAIEKASSVHYALDEVKAQLKQMLDQQKMQEAMGKVEGMLDSMKVKIDSAFKDELRSAAQQKQEDLRKQMEQVQQAPKEAKQQAPKRVQNGASVA